MYKPTPVLLSPAFKDYLWGGEKLAADFGFKTDVRPVAEAWMLSLHPEGESTIRGGEFDKRPLGDILKLWGREVLGEKGRKFESFPLLIKLIDAKQSLSVQVHPPDEYALKNEGEYGKTEMWYVADCEEGACLYFGFRHEISRDEFRDRIQNNTLPEVLKEVPVKKGDVFFIEAGTIHAIGEGLLIAEIQQNSNSTYRVYDYGRTGPDGNPRPLHIEKALDVTRLGPAERREFPRNPEINGRHLSGCENFDCYLINAGSAGEINVNLESFAALLVLEGTGSLIWDGGALPLKKGDCAFIPAGTGIISFKGDAEMIYTRI